ncbi:mannitol 1-phosphate dehydrogenase 2 [Mytilinidion resinicola]|uniref:Mannitol 1-phosphate dehydrogenase 2 n=1 Tax=Mytilinidion resinicola TaxID=574789 RepID=A0A6A6Z4T3_9PEZI|nr:mannitol 1-phosphate dehydrogenase 2 [Mytilinidion resinicola]KAF2815185.1 mannitol 1-phosphate dehydrogenase 2 [Mytilinidion resinicola]
MAHKPNVAIVGGGIAGLTLAIGLLKHDVPITLYEAAARFGEIGAGVGFGPNSVRAMTLLDPEIKEGFLRRKTANQWPSHEKLWFSCRVGDARYKFPEGSQVGDLVCDVEFTNPNSRGGVHRAHFLDEMVKLVPEELSRFGKKLVDVEEAGDGSGDVVLKFADGTKAQHTAVIGCDGIKSRTREILLGKDDPAARAVFSGKYAYRGLVPMEKAMELLGEEKAVNSQLYFGYHGHVLTFPIEKGKTMNVVAFASRSAWPSKDWVVHTTKDEMLEDFAEWGSTVHSIISLMQKPDIWALFNHPPASTYHKKRICILGDAAHASTPHQGAGAGMAIEDAYILANLVGDAVKAGTGVAGLETAFEAYDLVRRPRTQNLVETSREASMLYDFELEGDDLEAIERNIRNRMGWIWDVNLPAELERARAIVKCRK